MMKIFLVSFSLLFILPHSDSLLAKEHKDDSILFNVARYNKNDNTFELLLQGFSYDTVSSTYPGADYDFAVPLHKFFQEYNKHPNSFKFLDTLRIDSYNCYQLKYGSEIFPKFTSLKPRDKIHIIRPSISGLSENIEILIAKLYYCKCSWDDSWHKLIAKSEKVPNFEARDDEFFIAIKTSESDFYIKSIQNKIEMPPIVQSLYNKIDLDIDKERRQRLNEEDYLKQKELYPIKKSFQPFQIDQQTRYLINAYWGSKDYKSISKCFDANGNECPTLQYDYRHTPLDFVGFIVTNRSNYIVTRTSVGDYSTGISIFKIWEDGQITEIFYCTTHPGEGC
jgi:hypothetical protein